MTHIRLVRLRGFQNPVESFKSKEIIGNEFFTREGNILVRFSHPNTSVLIDKEQEGLHRIAQALDDLFYDFAKEQGLKLDFDQIDKIIESVKTVALRRY